MYRHTVAVFTAASAVLLTGAAPAHAEGESAAPTARCGNFDVISINVSPPPPLAGNVTTEEISALLHSIADGTLLSGFFTQGMGVPAVPWVPYGTPLAASPAPDQAGPTLPPFPRPSLPPLPSPRQSPFPNPGQPPFPNPSQAPLPNPSQSALPNPSQAPFPSPGRALDASPGQPLNANSGESSPSPLRVVLEDLINQALACARSTASPGTNPGTPPGTVPGAGSSAVPGAGQAAGAGSGAGAWQAAGAGTGLAVKPLIGTAALARYLEALVTGRPSAACAPAPGPATGQNPAQGQAPAQNPAQGQAQSAAQGQAQGQSEGATSLLAALGVRHFLEALAGDPAACPPAAPGAPSVRSSSSLLESIGVTDLFGGLAGRG
ncbi:hypothetical protein [Nonomuraea candida]|uniref:hypothetical protein n=1 Tax=Nonomuraea candida TaxID=359159 RepID=UPI0005B99A74|nr:hypothetical protein [Nonomuraea candida]